MPSSKKQKARKKRSRQSNGMSDIANLDVMLGGFPFQELESDHEGRNYGPFS